MSTLTPQQAFELANEHIRVGRFGEAAALCHQILEAMPEQPDVLHLLGVAAYQTGQMQDALQYFRRGVAANPESSGTRNNLACTLIELGQFAEAIAEYRIALRAKPFDADMHSNLADALYHVGQYDEAATACRTALALRPDLATAHNNLGNALRGLRQYDAAIAAYRNALHFQPHYADAQNNLGAILSDRFENEAAIEAFRLALEWNPRSVSALNNLGCALSRMGRSEEAVAVHRRAIELCPGDPLLHSNLIYSLQFIAEVDPKAIAAEQAEWSRRHARPHAASIASHSNPPDPERRLKVGYVSPDFREHPVAFFLAGLFAAQDRSQIETHCYSSVSLPDAATALLRQRADVWHEVFTLSHDALAEKIRADQIDILVDLSMHSADNRLPVFARKPAPVQLSWLAYPGTTGLETIDYRITDATMEPRTEVPAAGPERPIHLPDAWCCYEPIGPFSDVGDLPARRVGYPTFGSLSKTSRVNDRVLRCWAQLAERVPNAHWIILYPEGGGRERVRQFFGRNAERLRFVNHRGWMDYLQLFGEIDLYLDTFPCNGLTATCHALWMGAPVVTLAGTSPAARAGASILGTSGLSELIAHSEAGYVDLAADLARDESRLAELRATLRKRMRDSPLMDAARFAGHIELAYRNVWRRWCQSRADRPASGKP